MTRFPHRARRYGYRIRQRFREDPFSIIVLYALFFSLIFLIFAFRGLIATIFIKPLGIINPAEPPSVSNETTTPTNSSNSFTLQSTQTYTVKTGDTLQSIADALNLDVQALAKANDLKPPYDLKTGQELKLP